MEMMSKNHITQQASAIAQRLIERHVQEAVIAQFLGIKIADTALDSSTSNASQHKILRSAILQKYSNNEVIACWVKNTPPKLMDDVLEWIESDLLTRN
jgi:hypothetical protein